MLLPVIVVIGIENRICRHMSLRGKGFVIVVIIIVIIIVCLVLVLIVVIVVVIEVVLKSIIVRRLTFWRSDTWLSLKVIVIIVIVIVRVVEVIVVLVALNPGLLVGLVV